MIVRIWSPLYTLVAYWLGQQAGALLSEVAQGPVSQLRQCAHDHLGWHRERGRLQQVWNHISQDACVQHVQMSDFEGWLRFLTAGALQQRGSAPAGYELHHQTMGAAPFPPERLEPPANEDGRGPLQ